MGFLSALTFWRTKNIKNEILEDIDQEDGEENEEEMEEVVEDLEEEQIDKENKENKEEKIEIDEKLRKRKRSISSDISLPQPRRVKQEDEAEEDNLKVEINNTTEEKNTLTPFTLFDKANTQQDNNKINNNFIHNNNNINNDINNNDINNNNNNNNIIIEEEKAKILEDAVFAYNSSGLDIYQYNSRPFNTIEATNQKVILVVGQTGSGKTTLLNSLVNFILGVKFEDKFRYILINENNNNNNNNDKNNNNNNNNNIINNNNNNIINNNNYKKGENKVNQAHSQTKEVTRYYIRSHNGYSPILLIDTPGFGDTSGPLQDNAITSKIANLFQSQIDKIDVIAFVIQSALPRLTPSQKYVFTKVLEIFGNDMASNFVATLTFADGEEPQALAACNEFNVPRTAILKFNNSAIFSSKRDTFTKLFWEMGMIGFNELFNLLSNISAKSLKLTNEVLQSRRKLETMIIELRPQINIGLTRLEAIFKLIKELKAREEEMNASKDFNIEYEEPQAKTIQLPPGVHTTTCLQCNRTCHKDCKIPDDGNKFNCSAMDNEGNCTVCPNLCKWDSHNNTPYYIEFVVVKKVHRSEDLYRRYVDAESDKNKSQQILEGMVGEFVKLQREVTNLIKKVYHCVKKLREIALMPQSLGVEDYIDLLIETEKSEKKLGWKARLQALTEIKNNNQFLKSIEDPNFNPFREQQEQVAAMLQEINLPSISSGKYNFLQNFRC